MYTVTTTRRSTITEAVAAIAGICAGLLAAISTARFGHHTGAAAGMIVGYTFFRALHTPAVPVTKQPTVAATVRLCVTSAVTITAAWMYTERLLRWAANTDTMAGNPHAHWVADQHTTLATAVTVGAAITVVDAIADRLRR